MSYDRYRSWSLPIASRATPAFIIHPKTLEEQVLEDLAAAKDDVEKLEILDSFAAYKQRVYRQTLADGVADEIARSLSVLLRPIVMKRVPEPWILHRGRIGKDPEPKSRFGEHSI
jgi:hypothetical protein